MLQKKYICGIFGFPIRHTASPAMHHAAFQYLKMDGVYLAFQILPDDLKKAIEALRALHLNGVNVTIPYKEKVCHWLDELSPEAAQVGAVNTIKNEDGRLIGFNTDVQGFKKALEEGWGRSLKNARLLVIGAGGAARAVAVQGALSRVRSISILNRSEIRLKILIRHLKVHFPEIEVTGCVLGSTESRTEIGAADCVVNATSLGMAKDDPMPISPNWLDPRTYVYDLIYNPSETTWIREAIARGCRASGGMNMLLYQGALSFQIWTGRRAPIEVMRKALKNSLKFKV